MLSDISEILVFQKLVTGHHLIDNSKSRILIKTFMGTNIKVGMITEFYHKLTHFHQASVQTV